MWVILQKTLRIPIWKKVIPINAPRPNKSSNFVNMPNLVPAIKLSGKELLS